MKTKSGVYGLLCIETLQWYIGSSVKLSQRKADHFSTLRRNKSKSKKLQAVWNKYGEIAFLWEVLEYVEDISKLHQREQYYIDLMESCITGYNTEPKANVISKEHIANMCRLAAIHNKGKERSAETKAKQSLAIRKAFAEKSSAERRLLARRSSGSK